MQNEEAYILLQIRPTATKNLYLVRNNNNMSQQQQSGRRYVSPGACVSSQEVVCALEASACPSTSRNGTPFTFFSSAQLHAASDTSNPGVICLALPMAELSAGGRCLADIDQRQCTSHATGCTVADRFSLHDNTCNLEIDTTRVDALGSPLKTLYPKCKRDTEGYLYGKEYCVWDILDCNPWETPQGQEVTMVGYPVSMFSTCTCDQVQTGACMTGQQYFCAVTQDACAADEVFVPYHVLHSPYGPGLDCRLCREDGNLNLPSKTNYRPPSNGSSDESSVPQPLGPSGSFSASSSSSDGGGLEKAAAAGISGVVGLIVGVLLVLVILRVRTKSSRFNNNNSSDDQVDNSGANNGQSDPEQDDSGFVPNEEAVTA